MILKYQLTLGIVQIGVATKSNNSTWPQLLEHATVSPSGDHARWRHCGCGSFGMMHRPTAAEKSSLDDLKPEIHHIESTD